MSDVLGNKRKRFVTAQQLRSGVAIRDRTCRFRIFRTTFLGHEAVTYLVEHGFVPTREDAVVLGRKLQSDGFFYGCTDPSEFSDKPAFYRFVVDDDTHFRQFWITPRLTTSAPLSAGKHKLTWRFQPHISHNSVILDITSAEKMHYALVHLFVPHLRQQRAPIQKSLQMLNEALSCVRGQAHDLIMNPALWSLSEKHSESKSVKVYRLRDDANASLYSTYKTVADINLPPHVLAPFVCGSATATFDDTSSASDTAEENDEDATKSPSDPSQAKRHHGISLDIRGRTSWDPGCVQAQVVETLSYVSDMSVYDKFTGHADKSKSLLRPELHVSEETISQRGSFSGTTQISSSNPSQRLFRPSNATETIDDPENSESGAQEIPPSSTAEQRSWHDSRSDEDEEELLYEKFAKFIRKNRKLSKWFGGFIGSPRGQREKSNDTAKSPLSSTVSSPASISKVTHAMANVVLRDECAHRCSTGSESAKSRTSSATCTGVPSLSLPPPRIVYRSMKPVASFSRKRDAVVIQDSYQYEDGTIISVEISVQHRMLPPRKGYVRACVFGYTTLVSPLPGGNGSRVSILSQIHHNGSVPTWMHGPIIDAQTTVPMRMLIQVADEVAKLRDKFCPVNKDDTDHAMSSRRMIDESRMASARATNTSQNFGLYAQDSNISLIQLDADEDESFGGKKNNKRTSSDTRESSSPSMEEDHDDPSFTTLDGTDNSMNDEKIDGLTLRGVPECNTASCGKTHGSSPSSEFTRSRHEAPSIDKHRSEFEGRSGVQLSDFEILAVLGRGGYGKVLHVRHIKTDSVYAMKALRKKEVIRKKQIQRTLLERDILSAIRHPFVVELKYAFQTPTKLYLVMEFIHGGDFFTLLSRYGAVEEERCRLYMAELILALEHLHSRGVVYRDLKPENVLIDMEGHVKLTDFGLSRFSGASGDKQRQRLMSFSVNVLQGQDASANAQQVTNSFCGTEQYMAPEVLLQRGHTYAVDWWSLGILFSEVLTGRHPFRGQTHLDTLRNMINPQISPITAAVVSPNAASLMTGLLQCDPTQRLGAAETGGVEQLKKHPFFAGLDWEKVFQRQYSPAFKPQVMGEVDTQNFESTFTRESPVDSVASAVGSASIGISEEEFFGLFGEPGHTNTKHYDASAQQLYTDDSAEMQAGDWKFPRFSFIAEDFQA